MPLPTLNRLLAIWFTSDNISGYSIELPGNPPSGVPSPLGTSPFGPISGGVTSVTDLKVRTALDRAAQRIQGKFGKQPAVEAAIRSAEKFRNEVIFPSSLRNGRGYRVNIHSGNFRPSPHRVQPRCPQMRGTPTAKSETAAKLPPSMS
jgi:hypothetical protein